MILCELFFKHENVTYLQNNFVPGSESDEPEIIPFKVMICHPSYVALHKMLFVSIFMSGLLFVEGFYSIGSVAHLITAKE